MKKLLLITSILLSLGGCAAFGPKLPDNTVVKNKVVLISLPDDFYNIPDNVSPPDLNNPTQRDVSDWITRNELRTSLLENKLLTLKNYYIFSYNLLSSLNGKDSVIVVDPTAGADAISAMPSTTPVPPAKLSFKNPTEMQKLIPTNQPKNISDMFKPQPAFVHVVNRTSDNVIATEPEVVQPKRKSIKIKIRAN